MHKICARAGDMSTYDKKVLSMCNGNGRQKNSSDRLCSSSHLSSNDENSGHHRSSSVKHGRCSNPSNDLNMNGGHDDHNRER